MQIVFTNVLILFILLFIGYILGARKVIAHSSINDFTNLLVDVSIPCTIVVSMIRPFSSELIGDATKVILLAFVFHIVMANFAYFLTRIFKVDKKKVGSWIFAIVFSNNGFIGYPLMYSLYGNDGLFIMVMANIVQNLLIFSLGIKLITLNYNLKDKVNFRNVIFTRQNFAVVIGLLIYFTQFKIPKPAFDLLNYVSSLTVPLSMIIVGLSLSKYDFKEMFTDREAYRLTFVRMIAIPIFLLFLIKIFKIDVNSNLPYAIMFYTAVLPSPAFTTIMAERYNTSVGFSSKCVFITTILSVLTVPIFAGLL
ncbi:AEC family transporter [Peptostreptococcus porci]|uniref:AEC family transporter n=1 Tax=Peptostreptococcus porci TaxID=2652282 RepID=A0A6N7XDQ8_9FIRM|nr:AEC family transporter [Peptostreptococcus porci]MDY2795086.1 AEC family transporter [Peptostreptococcus porci]MDY4127953.1 AEC family transporter [Peptostreptococcus porci]MDY4560169.1 AEC family transporter [Peptostreptococcus porci]MDY5436733.1 AEC family transporter [Peptostreptococcus porci]MDY5479337.1 AEC family transporter [Peptostreptococcus porci]